MAQYEIDLYGKELYGAPLYIAFDAGDVRAEQNGHNRLDIFWDTPKQTRDSVVLAGSKPWTRMRLVRSPYGIPSEVEDGQTLLDVTASGMVIVDGPDGPEEVWVPRDDPTAYADDDIVPGKTYYYAVYVASVPDDYSSWQTYQPGDIVTFGGVSYRCLDRNTQGVDPGTDAAKWEITDVTAPWYRAGVCVGVAVVDHRHTELLYELTPRPYKVGEVETTATTTPYNDELGRFLGIFGFGFDIIKTENDRLRWMTDLAKCSERQLALIAYQMGILDQMPGLAELRRTFMRDATLIMRTRGTPEAASALVTSMTGWEADVTLGYNRMLDQEMAAFESPRVDPWDTDDMYRSHVMPVQLAPLVTYGTDVYRSLGSSFDYSAFDMAAGAFSETGAGTLRTGRLEPLAIPYRGYSGLVSASVNDTLTIKFDLPIGTFGGAGTYDIFLTMLGDDVGATIQCQINGVNVGPVIDTYRESRQAMNTIRLTSPTGFAFDSSHLLDNSLTFKVTKLNPLVVGTKGSVLVNYWTLAKQGTVPNRGKVPNASPTYWQLVTPGSVRDVDTQLNPLSDGFGRWNGRWDGASGIVYNPHPTGPGTSLWYISRGGAQNVPNIPLTPGAPALLPTGNSLAMTVPAGDLAPATLRLFNCGAIKTPTWDVAARYFAGQAVAYNAHGLRYDVYVARSGNDALDPELNDDTWKVTSRERRVPDDPDTDPQPEDVQEQGIPLPWYAEWSGGTAYKKFDIVSYTGHLYQAALPSVRSISPSGDSTDNRSWRWLGWDVQRYTFTFFHRRSAGATKVRPSIFWYTASGSYIGKADVVTSPPQILERFEFDNASFPNNNAGPWNWTAPPAWRQGVWPLPWVVARGNWSTVNGVAYPINWGSSSPLLEKKAGRMLRMQRSLIWGAGGSDDTVYATFVSSAGAPPDGDTLYEMEHGIAVRYGSLGTGQPTAFFLASRTRLTYNEITFDAAGVVVQSVTLSTLATWPAITDGTRVRVIVGPTTIQVHSRPYRSTGGSWVQLASITNNVNVNDTTVGWLERQIPKGA